MKKIKTVLSKYKSHIILVSLTAVMFYALGHTVAFNEDISWVYHNKNNTPTYKEIDQILWDQFKGKFNLVHESFENIDILIASSSTYPDSIIENDVWPYDEKASPLIIVQDSKSKRIKRVYEITFNRTVTKDYNTGNIIHPGKVRFMDLDNDSVKELFTEWRIGWGGSGGYVGMISFKKTDNDLLPMVGYPVEVTFPIDKTSMRLTEKIENISIDGPVIGTSSYNQFTDLNGDKKLEFLYGNYNWQEGEAHFGEHYWNLQVFELKDGKYQIADWWNGGKSLKTSKKYGFFKDGDFPSIDELMLEFNSKVASPEAYPKADVDVITNQENTEDYEFTIAYPQFVIKQNDNPTYSSINKDIKKIVEDELNYFKGSVTPINSPAGFGIQNTFYLSYEIANLTDNVYSLEINTQHFYNGAAHPFHNIFTYNYDLKKKKVINITDLLINSKSLDKISSIAINKLENNFKASGQYYDNLTNSIKNGASPDIQNYARFLIKKDGLEILFNEYQVASYADGQPRVFIPYGEIKDLFSPEYIFLIKK